MSDQEEEKSEPEKDAEEQGEMENQTEEEEKEERNEEDQTEAEKRAKNVEAELTEPEEGQGDEGKGSSKDVKKEKKRLHRRTQHTLLRIIDVAQDEEGGWVNSCTFMIHLCLVIVLEV